MINKTWFVKSYKSNEFGSSVSRHTIPVGNLGPHGYLALLQLGGSYYRYWSYLILINGYYQLTSDDNFRTTIVASNGAGNDYNPTISYDGSNLVIDIGSGTASEVYVSFLIA